MGKASFFTKIKAKSWKHARTLLEGRKFGKADWVFRGEADSTWKLETTLERCIFQNKTKTKDKEYAEKVMLSQFKNRAPHYLNNPNDIPNSNDTLGWLALMQHHGSPTRLLDFTTSPYVGAFFAFEEALKKKSCSIWAMNSLWFHNKTVGYLIKQGGIFDRIKEKMKKDRHVDLGQEEYFNQVFIDNPFCPKLIDFVFPRKSNNRMYLQQGLFLCPGNLSTIKLINQFDIYKNSKEFVHKIILSRSWRDEAMKDLRKMNISRESLFPGLDGFAKSMRDRVFIEALSSKASRSKVIENRFALRQKRGRTGKSRGLG